MSPLDKAVVAVLDQNDHICGSGFLAAERLIVTCAHVVESATNAGNTIKGRFHTADTAQELTLLSDGWFPEHDLAVLQWHGDLPPATSPLNLGSSENCAGHEFLTLGYPLLGDYRGIPARGVIDGQTPKENGRMMLKLSAADVAQGHSGAPLFDETLLLVVGMVSEVFHPTGTTKHRDAAFAIPMDTVWDLFPALRPRQKRTNPFYVGGRINDPTLFFGRQRLLREVKGTLNNHNNVSIVGDSQIGKSSLLYYLYATREAWEPRDRVLFVDLQGVWDVADFCATVLDKLGSKGDQPRDLKMELLKTDTILLLDEIEQLTDPDFTPKLLSLLRSVAQEPQVALCIASQKPLDEVFPAQQNDVSPFHNIFSKKKMAPFSEEVARDFLNSRLAPTGVQFSDGEVERVLQESAGHPASLQKLARDLYKKYVD